jgi:DNA-binding transcriptional ArsR family regulator
MCFNLRTKDSIIIFMTLNIIDPESSILQPYDLQAQFLKVLTHPARLAILKILQDGEHCVCHMEAHLGLRQAYISQQLSVLRQVGLIQDRRDGWNIFYRVTDPRVYAVIDAVQKITGQNLPEVSRQTVSCNCPQCSSQGVVREK